jgi:hypothetical protein
VFGVAIAMASVIPFVLALSYQFSVLVVAG